ncbi:MAG: fibronectin type III domain-containing protein [Candidatus Planktophila sp.]
MSSIMKRATRGALILALLAGVISPLQAQALSPFLQREATQWGYVYAGPNTTVKQSPRGKVAYIESKSKFVVNYKNFPEWAKKDFQAAVDVWSANFSSTVPVTIDATWTRIGTFGVLGSARPGSYFSGFDKAPDSSLWYPSALANALAGKDLDTRQSEIIIQVNSLAEWNTRNDGISHPNEYDLQSVFLHEMGHGLGFLSTDSYDSFFGYGSIDQPTPFDAYVQVEDGRRLSDLPTPSIELGKALTSPLVWSGPLGIAANNGTKPILYTPSKYEEGSSVSHLDEATYSKSAFDAVMTPNLDAGEIFHEPGPLLLAMMEDMRRKPPVGIAVGVPQQVRNVNALVADGAAIVTFDPPANARTAQITSYSVRNLKTNQIKSATSSPISFSGLKNGTSYTFAVTASNSNGTSDPANTVAVTPQPSWKRFVVDSKSDASVLASTTFNGEPAVAYIDSKSGDLKLATWSGTVWIKLTVDGAGGSSGRTNSAIKGALSMCVNGSGKKQTLHIFYSDAQNTDLRYAKFDGKKFIYEVVDGDAAQVNNYEDPIRVRTGSDLSVSSACIASAGGVQVLYRDESQGILLGAVKSNTAKSWSYELVDGDRKTDGRTTGDVAFHLKAAFDGKTSYFIYDSILTINQKKDPTTGEVRVATRGNLSSTGWIYQTLEATSSSAPVVGYDVALGKNSKGIFATWLSSAPNTLPYANRIRWSYISSAPTQESVTSENFGKPGKYLSTNGTMIAFNCEKRICAVDTSQASPKISFVATSNNPDGISSTWVVVNRVKYLLAGINGQLSMLRP